MRRVSTAVHLILVLGLAWGLRFGAAGVWQHRLGEQKFGFGDSESYWQLGAAIAKGRPYVYGDPPRRVFRAPGYPLLLAGLFRVAGSNPPPLVVRAYSAALSAAAVLGAYWMGRLWRDAGSGLAAAWIVAVYPGAVISGALLLSEGPFCALMLMQFALWQCGSRLECLSARLGVGAACGAVAGCATVVRPSWLLFTPLAVALSVSLPGDRRRGAAFGGAIVLGLLAAMAPWWLRNHRVTGHFVPTTLQVGASLYDSWNPAADGSSNMEPVDELAAQLRAGPCRGRDGEYCVDRHLANRAWRWARENPSRAANLALIKLRRMWNLWPNHADFRSWPVRLLFAVSFVPLVALGLLGSWRLREDRLMRLLCWLPAIYLSLLHMVFVSSIRYRIPAVVVLAVPAGAWLAQRWTRNPRTLLEPE